MRVAVLTLTRDRLPYTQHCFARLRDNAGCRFDHYVLDQGSEDGTPEWLRTQPLTGLVLSDRNIGIHAGMNALVDLAGTGYDVVVKFDNDCELVTPDTVAVLARLVMLDRAVLSPGIDGIGSSPEQLEPFQLDGVDVDQRVMVGGIFMACPSQVFDGFRFDETRPTWGYADGDLCAHVRATGGRVGYVPVFRANHYLTTWGQATDIPWYFDRVKAEGAP